MPKRRTLIREIDFQSLPKKQIKNYAKIEFMPLTKEYFERRATYFALKNKQYLADQYALYEYPNAMLGRLTSVKLHDRRYPSWLVRFNNAGELVVRAGMRQPESRIGLMTIVEK